MKYMFLQCSSLKELYSNNFNTKNVTDMNSMFWERSPLKKLNFIYFNTVNIKILIVFSLNILH